MECEKVDITVLVVDDDNISLSVIACMLKSFQYKVLIANNGYEALETLREYEGFVDIIITELHMPAMNGLELQKLISKEFQIPVIVMSEDRRKCVRTKSLESGAVGFMVKPMRPDDLKNVWQYAVAAREGKTVANEELGTSEGQSSISSEVGNVGDVNSDKSSETKPKRGRKTKGNKRKASVSESTDTNKDMSKENGQMPLKKPKVVWTTELHNQFLMAIKQIGLGKAVPKRILVLMNVPGLTRENVASHLQKYRIFLRKVSQIGAMKGLSDRVLRSKFASGLINDIRKRTTQIRLPIHQPHMRATSSRGTVTATNSSVLQARTGQLPIPLHRRRQNLQTQLPPRVSSSLNNRIRLDNPNPEIIGSNAIQTNNHYFQQQREQPILGHYQNPLHQANQRYNASASLLANGGEGLVGCNDMNYASFGNSSFNYAPSNGNLGYFGNINLSQNATNNCHPSNGFQLNDGRLTMAGMNQTGVITSVGITALEGNNSFGLINGSSNSIMHSNPLGVTNGTPNAMMPATPTGNNNGRMDQLGLSNVRVPPYENNTSDGFANSASNAIMPVAKTWNGRIDQGGLHSVVAEPAYGNNSFGFKNGNPNAIMPIAATTDVDSGLFQASAARVRSGSELQPPIINNVIQEENVSGLPPLPEQLDYLPLALTNNATQEGNISELPLSSEQPDGLRNAGNENQYNNLNILSQGQDQQYSEDDLSELSFMLDNMHHLDGEQHGELQVANFIMFPTQTENSDGGEFINPDFSNSSHAEQYLEQLQGDIGRINVPATEGNIYIPNKLLPSSEENPNQPQGINEFVGLEEQLSRYIVDNAASASNSDTEQENDWDTELVGALFGTDQNVSV